MESDAIQNETDTHHALEELWDSLMNTQSHPSACIQHLPTTASSTLMNSIDSIRIVEQRDEIQIDGDIVALMEEADFSLFLDTLNEDSTANVVHETVTIQDTTEAIQATDRTHQQSSSNQERPYNQHPYPPTCTRATASDHDKPYFEFSSMNLQTLITNYRFDLEGTRTRQQRDARALRLNNHGHAILTQTQTTKEDIMNFIHDEFQNASIKYVCIGEISQPDTTQRSLGIQIILGKIVNKKVAFLDSITKDPNCNYHVTTNDQPWNYYIKRSNQFLEYGEFSSVHNRSHKKSSSTSTTVTTPMVTNSQVIHDAPSMANKASTVTHTFSKTVQRKTLKRAMKLAKVNVHAAMDMMRKKMPYEFLLNSDKYLKTFRYIRTQSRRSTEN